MAGGDLSCPPGRPEALDSHGVGGQAIALDIVDSISPACVRTTLKKT